MSVGHLYVVFGEMSGLMAFSGLVIFSFLGVEFGKYVLDPSPLSAMSFVTIFSHSIGCLLVLLIVSFAVQKLFILMKSQQFIFAFVSLAFGVV